MRGSVGVVLGASGDWACLTVIGLLWRPPSGCRRPKRGAYTRKALFREFYLGGVAGAGAAGADVPGVAAFGARCLVGRLLLGELVEGATLLQFGNQRLGLVLRRDQDMAGVYLFLGRRRLQPLLVALLHLLRRDALGDLALQPEILKH